MHYPDVNPYASNRRGGRPSAMWDRAHVSVGQRAMNGFATPFPTPVAPPIGAPGRVRNPPCPPGQIMVDGNCVDDDYYQNVAACNFICNQSSPSKECFPPDGICVPFISQIGVAPPTARTQLQASPATMPLRRPRRARRSLRRRSALIVKLKERGLA